VDVAIWIDEFMGKEFFVTVGRGLTTDCALQPENKTTDKVRRITNERGDCFVALEAPLAMTGLKGIAP
jgi:hypothetical protein